MVCAATAVSFSINSSSYWILAVLWPLIKRMSISFRKVPSCCCSWSASGTIWYCDKIVVTSQRSSVRVTIQCNYYYYYHHFTALCLELHGWAGIKNINPLTPIMIINHPLSASSICMAWNNAWEVNWRVKVNLWLANPWVNLWVEQSALNDNLELYTLVHLP